MNTLYLDTSAAVKLLVEEDESADLAHHLDDLDGEVVAGLLLETELRRFAVRHGISQGRVTEILEAVSLYDMPRSLYHEAGVLPDGRLRSLDALHLAVAVRLEVDVLATYDDRMRQAAEGLGLTVVAPGR